MDKTHWYAHRIQMNCKCLSEFNYTFFSISVRYLTIFRSFNTISSHKRLIQVLFGTQPQNRQKQNEINTKRKCDSKVSCLQDKLTAPFPYTYTILIHTHMSNPLRNLCAREFSMRFFFCSFLLICFFSHSHFFHSQTWFSLWVWVCVCVSMFHSSFTCSVGKYTHVNRHFAI